MLILSLTYKKSLEEADRFMDQHLAWLRQGYERGWFLASGRKVPRTGGVILAAGDRAEIEAFAVTDPFVVNGIADCEVTETLLTTVAPGFESLKS
ncbi:MULTISPECIES: YciI family protein [Ciceribacter]|uniref:Uncharacterized protein YciI n=1 Tax=Ciceribacter lividus TaxID=1197950 RepID=A0A6I7HL09_9HYPH|nr:MULTISPECIES: YciI family protein [Ciceribacter]MCO6179961.1 YciI family protein [Ciceribacter sp. RN22]RCW21966.1 uncharacterized protein YciI [Ciceribacter lividus]